MRAIHEWSSYRVQGTTVHKATVQNSAVHKNHFPIQFCEMLAYIQARPTRLGRLKTIQPRETP